MINRRNLLWLVPAMAMVSAPLWWPLAHQFLEPRGDFSVPPSISGPRDQIFTMENMTLSQHRGEVEELRVTAARVRTGDNQKDMEMEEVTAVAPGAADNGPLRIRGNSGIYDSEAATLSLRGDVVITTVRGDAVRTEALTYLINRARITNDQPVLLTSANLEIRGTGLDLDLNNGRLTLGGRVACIIR